MLNHFGIYHLHLGDGIKNGFRKRSGDLLCIYLKNNNIYILGIFPHKNWIDEDKIQIITDNWPEALQEYEILGIQDIESYSKEECIKLRKENIYIFIKLNNKIYSINFGIMSSGDSLFSVHSSDELINKILCLEKEITSNFKDLISENDYLIIKELMKFYNLDSLHLKIILKSIRTKITLRDNDNKIFQTIIPLTK